MLGEIDRDFYCSSSDYNELSGNCIRTAMPCVSCGCKHRKYLTREQFKEEYGFEWRGAVYFGAWSSNDGKSIFVHDDDIWHLYSLETAMEISARLKKARKKAYITLIVCACTPWGRPDKDWRP